MNEHMSPIPSRIYNAAVGGHVAGADQIIDDETGLTLDKVAGGALEEKEYTSGSNNGMGRVVLRKNLVGGVNTLTQAMINQANTIYIIQYDFTLGEDITVPANCILEFDGGSISGESISPNSCIIVNNSNSAIFRNITVNATDYISKQPISVDWFSNDNNDDYENFLNAILFSGNVVFKGEKSYSFKSIENFARLNYESSYYNLAPKYAKIEGNGCTWNIEEDSIKDGDTYSALMFSNGYLEAENINIVIKEKDVANQHSFRCFATTEEHQDTTVIKLKNINVDVLYRYSAFAVLAQMYAGKEISLINCHLNMPYRVDDTMKGGFCWVQHTSNNTIKCVIEDCSAKCANIDEIISLSHQNYGSTVYTNDRKIIALYSNSTFEMLGDSTEVPNRMASLLMLTAADPNIAYGSNTKIECYNCKFINNISNSSEKEVGLLNFNAGAEGYFENCTFQSEMTLSGGPSKSKSLFFFGENSSLQFKSCSIKGNNFLNQDAWEGNKTARISFESCDIKCYGFINNPNYGIRISPNNLSESFINCNINIISPIISAMKSFIFNECNINIENGESFIYCVEGSYNPLTVDYDVINCTINNRQIPNYGLDNCLLLATNYRLSNFPIYEINFSVYVLMPFILESQLNSTEFYGSQAVYYNKKDSVVNLRVLEGTNTNISINPGENAVTSFGDKPSVYYINDNTKDKKEFWGILRGFDDILKYGNLTETAKPAGANGQLPVGYMVFDKASGKPLWYNGSNWVDATGAQV